jgi:hypothetical protein
VFPACYVHDNIIAVASITRYETLSSFSNYGPESVHIGAHVPSEGDHHLMGRGKAHLPLHRSCEKITALLGPIARSPWQGSPSKPPGDGQLGGAWMDWLICDITRAESTRILVIPTLC